MRENSKENGFMLSIIKGTFTAIIITLIGVLIFAGVVKIAYLKSGVIKAVNQFIKVLSVFLGCFFHVKGRGGLLKGGLLGCFTAIITYLVFAFIGGETSFGVPFVLDLVFQLIIGAIAGIIIVNLKNK